MTFDVFSKSNLTAAQVTRLPFEKLGTFVRPNFEDKETYRSWCASPQTEHCFFNLVEGVNPHLRVSRRNMPHRLHGLIADFDGKNIPEEEVTRALQKISTDYRPTAWSRSFSGGVHMVWVFEQPVLYYEKKVWENFVAGFDAELGLKFMLPGFDDVAWKSWSQYYEVGTKWKDFGLRVSQTAVLEVLQGAIQAANYVGTDSSEIEWPDINRRIAELFPEVGELTEGQRTTRFWDDSADAESVIATSRGCHCFTGDKPFVTWAEILGRDWLEALDADRTAAAVSTAYRVGRSYFLRDAPGVWRDLSAGELETAFACKHNLNLRQLQGRPSEAKQAVDVVRETRCLDGVTEALYREEEVVDEGGISLLNISRVKVFEPVGESVEWGKSFPWISSYLDQLFGEEQLPYVIAWLAHFYTSARNHNLQNGLALAIAGPPSSGKTFFSTCLVSNLMGGSEEASAFLTSKDRFNDTLFRYPVLTVDDAVAASDPKASEVYTQMLKKITANQSISIRAMHRAPVSITWKGRIVVTMNEDVESLQMLPLTEYSLLDKISFFKVQKPNIDPRSNWYKKMMPELAYFAQYLADYKIPDELRGEKRFGVKPFHHPELLKSAAEAGPAAEIEDLLQEWREYYFTNSSLEPKDNEWKGGAAAMMKSLKDGNFDFRGGNRSLGRGMSRLAAQETCNWITRDVDAVRGNTYRIISPRYSQDIPETVKGPF
jgi:hypothetical protein